MGEKFKDFFTPIDNQLKGYEEKIKELKEQIDKEDPSKIYEISRSTAFAHYLLGNSLDDVSLWSVFFGRKKREDVVDFNIELNKRIQKFNELSKGILRVSDEMYKRLDEIQKEKGEEERKKIIKKGYVPPVDFVDFMYYMNEEIVYGSERNKQDPAFA